jgi:hypothetical protein
MAPEADEEDDDEHTPEASPAPAAQTKLQNGLRWQMSLYSDLLEADARPGAFPVARPEVPVPDLVDELKPRPMSDSANQQHHQSSRHIRQGSKRERSPIRHGSRQHVRQPSTGNGGALPVHHEHNAPQAVSPASAQTVTPPDSSASAAAVAARQARLARKKTLQAHAAAAVSSHHVNQHQGHHKLRHHFAVYAVPQEELDLLERALHAQEAVIARRMKR